MNSESLGLGCRGAAVYAVARGAAAVTGGESVRAGRWRAGPVTYRASVGAQPGTRDRGAGWTRDPRVADSRSQLLYSSVYPEKAYAAYRVQFAERDSAASLRRDSEFRAGLYRGLGVPRGHRDSTASRLSAYGAESQGTVSISRPALSGRALDVAVVHPTCADDRPESVGPGNAGSPQVQRRCEEVGAGMADPAPSETPGDRDTSGEPGSRVSALAVGTVRAVRRTGTRLGTGTIHHAYRYRARAPIDPQLHRPILRPRD